MPAQFVYAAASCIRYVNEYPEISFFWFKFREYVGDDAALILAHLFMKDGDTTYVSNPFWSSQHKWMDGPSKFGKKEFKRFVERDLSCLEGLPSLYENSDFRDVTTIWRKSFIINKFEWAGGEDIKYTGLSCNYIKRYNYDEMEKDLKLMMEINDV